jgi:hypothetical protein
MLATVMPSPVTPFWLQTSSALMFAMPHSTALATFSWVPAVTFGASTCTAG